jgi:hypothetical protein
VFKIISSDVFKYHIEREENSPVLVSPILKFRALVNCPSNMDESLSSLYVKADTLRRQIDDGSAQGDSQVVLMTNVPTNTQSNLLQCITLFQQCKRLVDQLVLFSANEGIDDVSSSEMKYSQTQ